MAKENNKRKKERKRLEYNKISDWFVDMRF